MAMPPKGGYTLLFSISFSILRRWISFWRALYSLRVTVSSSDTLIGESCFTQPLIVLRFTPYSRSSLPLRNWGQIYWIIFYIAKTTPVTLLSMTFPKNACQSISYFLIHSFHQADQDTVNGFFPLPHPIS